MVMHWTNLERGRDAGQCRRLGLNITLLLLATWQVVLRPLNPPILIVLDQHSPTVQIFAGEFFIALVLASVSTASHKIRRHGASW